MNGQRAGGIALLLLGVAFGLLAIVFALSGGRIWKSNLTRMIKLISRSYPTPLTPLCLDTNHDWPYRPVGVD